MGAFEGRGRADHEFFDWSGPRSLVEVDGVRVRGPAFYYRCDLVRSLHLASFEAVRSALPTPALHPVRWIDGRAAVVVAAMRYRDVRVGGEDDEPLMLTPYGEVMIAVPVTRRPAVRVLPALLPTWQRVGVFVLHLPVTTAEARDLGRTVWGLPKFVADMDFAVDSRGRTVKVSEGGHDVLSLTLRGSGPVLPDRAPVVLYSVRDHVLLETRLPFRGHRQSVPGAAGGRLTLGDHPVADALGRLDVSPEPLVTFSYLDADLILPEGVPVGSAQDHPGFAGTDRRRGRYTVQYPGTQPLDQYAAATGPLSAAGAAHR